MSDAPRFGAIRSVPRTGVIYVTTEAEQRGYRADDPQWCNLGQGQPETGELEGAPPRVAEIDLRAEDPDYAPVPGLKDLRAAVAHMYNRQFRRGMRSQYTVENVAISGGGRVALARVAASIGHVNLGHFLPDYTAYEELLEIFRAFNAIPILLRADRGYSFTVDELRREITGRGLSVLLVSNPCNPTGKLISGQALAGWVSAARDLDCTLLLDEFYSHYIWEPRAGDAAIVSAARYVEDVDRDPVVIIDGLTKNWRYPGWRVSWTLGPRSIIDAISSAGSFLDGGASRPMQRAAIALLEPAHVQAETQAIWAAFRSKREYSLERLRGMGVVVDEPPGGTFYVWGNLRDLPGELSDGMGLFRAALEQRVVTVPGQFFDVNPGGRRQAEFSRFRSHARFSFGPPMEVLERAFDRLEALIAARRAAQ